MNLLRASPYIIAISDPLRHERLPPTTHAVHCARNILHATTAYRLTRTRSAEYHALQPKNATGTYDVTSFNAALKPSECRYKPLGMQGSDLVALTFQQLHASGAKASSSGSAFPIQMLCTILWWHSGTCLSRQPRMRVRHQ